MTSASSSAVARATGGEGVAEASGSLSRNARYPRTLGRSMSSGEGRQPVHEPVMAREIVGLLAAPAQGEPSQRRLRPGAVVVDATVGLGGHAAALLGALPQDARLFGLDRDPEALEIAARRLAAFGDRVELVHARFSALGDVLRERGIERIDGLVADLGVSSLQLDAARRGFSFRAAADLDMRMDRTRGETAADLLRRTTESELAQLLAEYGEEPEARRIARAIARGPRPATTEELQAAVLAAVRRRPARRDPATLTFQALRIAVNRELEELDALLDALPGLLAPGARVAILSYHSLEDRRVKEAFRRWTASCVCPPGLPVCRCGGKARAVRLTRGALRPQPGEIELNPRARSARLRAVEWVDGR
jgi:16S rRNA (cytosine1402-N4)-methyltransferase